MTIRVSCPHPGCGQQHRLPDKALGEMVPCSGCGRRFEVREAVQETVLPEDTGGDGATPLAKHPGLAHGSIPKQVGRFQVREFLGAGAFGAVYLAYDPVLEREVALKVPQSSALENPTARARFLREPKAAAQLRHPNIVPVYDAGTDGERYYIASAFIKGRTLDEVISESRHNFRDAAKTVRNLAAALAYAHRLGVIHRDVKPANVMVDGHGEALLMDFGLAHLEGTDEKVTQDGSIMGTPAYMAPEQADASFGVVCPASDQYSLGVVLYELLCGETPFSGPPALLVFHTLHQTPPSPRHRNPAVPRDLETICLKAMAKRAQDRYADCDEMAEDLRRWLADEPIRARRLGPVEQLVRWANRNRLVASLAAMAAFVTVVGLVAATFLWRQAETQRQTAQTVLDDVKLQRSRVEKSLTEVTKKREAAEAASRTAKQQKELAEKAEQKARMHGAELEREQRETEVMRSREEQERQKAQQALAAANQAGLKISEAAAKSEAISAEMEKFQLEAQPLAGAERLQRYVADINSAMNALAQNEVVRVQELLKAHVSKEGQEDLRGFEWYYLADQCGLAGTTGTTRSAMARFKSLRVGMRMAEVMLPDSKTVAVLAVKGAFARFSLETGKLLAPADESLVPFFSQGNITAGHPNRVIAPNMRWLAVDGWSRGTPTFWLFSATGEAPPEFKDTYRPIFSNNGEFLAVLRGTYVGVPKAERLVEGFDVWEMKDEALRCQIRFNKNGVFGGVHYNYEGAISPEGKLLTTVGLDHERGEKPVGGIWNAQTGQFLRSLKLPSITQLDHMAFTNDGLEVVGCAKKKSVPLSNCQVYAWNVDDGNVRWTLDLLVDSWVEMRFIVPPRGRILAVRWLIGPISSYSDRAQDSFRRLCPVLVDVDAGSVCARLSSHGDVVNGLAFSPDGKQCATASLDGTIKLWNVEHGIEWATLKAGTRLTCLAFSPDGSVLAAGDEEGYVRVWQAQPRELVSGSPKEKPRTDGPL